MLETLKTYLEIIIESVGHAKAIQTISIVLAFYVLVLIFVALFVKWVLNYSKEF